MIINFLKSFFQPSEKIDFDDENMFVIADKILELQDRVEKLELENIELTNSLYECENRLEAKINNIDPVVYNLGTEI